MKRARDVREQLEGLMERIEVELCSADGDSMPIRKVRPHEPQCIFCISSFRGTCCFASAQSWECSLAFVRVCYSLMFCPLIVQLDPDLFLFCAVFLTLVVPVLWECADSVNQLFLKEDEQTGQQNSWIFTHLQSFSYCIQQMFFFNGLHLEM